MDATMQLFQANFEDRLTALIQRLSPHADSLTVETAFREGWQACIDFNSQAQIAEKDAYYEQRMKETK